MFVLYTTLSRFFSTVLQHFSLNQLFSQGVAMYSCLVLPPYAIFPGLSLVNTSHSQSHSHSLSCKLVWVIIPLKICPSNLVCTIFWGPKYLLCQKYLAAKFFSQNYYSSQKKSIIQIKFSAVTFFQYIFHEIPGTPKTKRKERKPLGMIYFWKLSEKFFFCIFKWQRRIFYCISQLNSGRVRTVWNIYVLWPYVSSSYSFRIWGCWYESDRLTCTHRTIWGLL